MFSSSYSTLMSFCAYDERFCCIIERIFKVWGKSNLLRGNFKTTSVSCMDVYAVAKRYHGTFILPDCEVITAQMCHLGLRLLDKHHTPFILLMPLCVRTSLLFYPISPLYFSFSFVCLFLLLRDFMIDVF